MKKEFIVPSGDPSALPQTPADFIQHFERLFELIPAGASNPKVDFDGRSYEVSYEREVTTQEEAEALRRAHETNRIATENLIKAEKAELRRLKDRYENH